MLNHFTSKAWFLYSEIPGRNGQYGSTTTLIGVFNHEHLANSAKQKFIKDYKKQAGTKEFFDGWLKIRTIELNKIDETVLSEIYE